LSAIDGISSFSPTNPAWSSVFSLAIFNVPSIDGYLRDCSNTGDVSSILRKISSAICPGINTEPSCVVLTYCARSSSPALSFLIKDCIAERCSTKFCSAISLSSTLLPFWFLISSICVSIVLTLFTNERNSLVSYSVRLRDSVPKPSLLTLALISSILSNKLLRCSFNSLIVAIKYYLHVVQPFCVP